MVQLVGDRFLPESVSSARQRVRSRLSDVREPIRSRRESLVPGPDLIGMAEDQVSSLRRRFVTRETLMERIRGAAPDMGNGNGSGSSDQEAKPASGSSDQMV